MQETHPFSIYNASAGSGKTYTLVKEYLKILFKSNHPEPFKRILAITFTNKAVAEMKGRIVEMLKAFSNPAVLNEPTPMFKDLCEELQMEPNVLREKSDHLLNTILHNYSAFDISTIDGFTHKVIRTFAHDLRLPLNFEVELDQDSLLTEAVDSLIAKAGNDDELTKILVDFAVEKADDDKSYDVAFDFNKIAKLLVKENDLPFIDTLKDKTLAEFKELKVQLRKEIATVEKDIVENAKTVLDLIAQSGLEFKDFSRSTLPNHFLKASKLEFSGIYNNNLEENIIERQKIYAKTAKLEISNAIDALLPEIELRYKTNKINVFHVKFLRAFYRNITPLSVLNAINTELTALKEEQNKMLISEFNAILSKEIAGQPTPFIYERLGEKFKYYFIDEFQDTSVMQWENLKPLLDNSLSGINGSTMLVGDAKQAIYRWRGGKAEQFMDLFNEKDKPFQINQVVKHLEANYRSFKAVVNFNNGLFKFLASSFFNDADHQDLYQNSTQHITSGNEGFVKLSFLDLDKEDKRDEEFPEAVLKTINTCLENGFKLEDICVLVRKKKEGVAIADYLSQHKVPIISSETLLINNSPEVVFINNVLALLVQPENNDIKIQVLNYLTTLFNIEEKHDFFTAHINLPTDELFKSFETYNVFIDANMLLQRPLYDLAETIVRSFGLVKTSNAYIQFYLDIVLDFSMKKGSDVSGFLDYFDKKKDNLSIISPEGQDAVQIMTIHKSKGLEFPVVIFPYADLDIYRELEPKEWFSLDKEKYNGFSSTLLNYNKDFEHYGEEGLRIFNKHQSEQELDSINLLYVALTRPVGQLHIISSKDISAKGEINNKKYSGLLINYLQHLGLWQDSELEYSFGDPKKVSEPVGNKKETYTQESFISTAKEDHNINVVTKSGLLWDTNQQEAIEKGNLIHNLMAKIETIDDVDAVMEDFVKDSAIQKEQIKLLKDTVLQIINHQKLKAFYTKSNTIYNERDIITKDGIILRPDRVIVNSDNEAVIIDYKTGSEDIKYAQQLQSYQDVLEEMDISVKKKVLVYINDDILVKDV
ncbi:AAA family ATPase [Algibacter amylolyticus]|uniref:DNA 3'-5' helicase n=1 Tax=Algibacter amylolyticus TaxID=1608400 RepID=A0A5M7BF30_9FLAO|nr:UvrD-helicase domain-containing protein [Algibacter amylolyticus]KAA5827530.1 AAA family ATPase [Algibacter amylolyticus]MBB5266733.1 ATP-dependent exoDNAse (exonuclease V) beta subunit [Algibacter amylolyticus]TSJ81775.1 AAA family ATPase [Algibacter amylolyticus]